MTRALRLLTAAVIALAGVVVLPQAAGADSSAVTVSGRGAFADLRVTVSQTRDLINQTVRVSWTGGRPTGPVGRFATDYLQVMQCWGDDTNGPTREQCQFGALEAQSGLGLGNFTKSRQIRYQDPRDPADEPPPAGGAAYVPFHSATGKQTTSYGEFFDSGGTNEVPFAKTRADGTGDLDFEVQTALEAYGLGCGTVVSGAPRHCWLVVVPRGDTEVNGKKPGVDHTSTNLDSSPLSATNWAQRMAVRLDFRPVGRACPIGVAEVPLTGNEFVADAVARWQPALCANGGTVYGFTQVPDGIARDQLGTPESGMAFVAAPVRDPVNPVVYAPVSVSGFAIAFVLERQSRGPGVDPPEVWQRDGQPLADVRLTPRLVAKLLTQSYRDVVPGNQPYLAANPRRLNDDPEFLDLNPELKVYGALMNALDVLTPSVDMDATEALWTWIGADPEARAFLDGKPDPSGMVVNRNYTGLALPLPNFPKSDFTCKQLPIGPDCAQTAHPLAADLHDAGRAISRGDTLGRTPNGLPDPVDPSKPGYSRVPRQPTGERSLLAVVDTATAARYGLPTASLRNRAGQFVAPTPAALTASLRHLRATSAPGVGVADPNTTDPAAYPLPAVTYAAAVPSGLTPAAGAAYARFLRFATGRGQTSGEATGQLPAGYLPLPADLRLRAAQAADTIERDAGKPPAAPEQPGPDGQEGGTADPGASAVDPTRAAAAPAAAPPTPGGVPAIAPAAAVTPTPAGAQAAGSTQTTPTAPVTWLLRYLLAGMLVLGGLSSGTAPLLLRRAREVNGG